MANNDSTLQGLPTLITPAKLDLIFVADQSDAYEAKKLTLETLCDMVLASAPCIDASGANLRLKGAMDADHNKITNLQAGTATQDAVNFGQVRHLLQDLDTIVPDTPDIRECGAHIEVSTSPVTSPAGGFYLYYWCVDGSASTQIALEGESVVASSGAEIHLDSAVAPIVNIPKLAGMKGKYFHVAVRYRNMGSLSSPSATATYGLVLDIFEDIFTTEPISPPSSPSISVIDNHLYINADPAADAQPGTTYLAELLFRKGEPCAITGNEVDLITLSSHTPNFVYNLTMDVEDGYFVSVRVAAVTVTGRRSYSDIGATGCKYDCIGLFKDEKALDMMASVLAELLQTAGGEPLVKK